MKSSFWLLCRKAVGARMEGQRLTRVPLAAKAKAVTAAEALRKFSQQDLLMWV